MLEQRRVGLTAKLASRLVGSYRNEGVQIRRLKERIKAERDMSGAARWHERNSGPVD